MQDTFLLLFRHVLTMPVMRLAMPSKTQRLGDPSIVFC